MNERIRELADQATTKISFRLDPNTYKHIDDPDGDLERFEFDKEKFAELVVEKFDDILVLELVDCIGNQDQQAEQRVERLRERVKTYFGVEE